MEVVEGAKEEDAHETIVANWRFTIDDLRFFAHGSKS